MDLIGIIESAEKQYKQILEGYFVSIYKEDVLPSHGLDHHRRVWKYSKELLLHVPLESSNQLPKLVEDLIIASYLHDIGMAVDPGVRHGKCSMELCSRFLHQYHLEESCFSDVLDAIENHDNKEYSGDIIQNDLLKILSTADDLDAFGMTGVYRYSEIYLARGITFENIGFRVIENAAKRFENFQKAFSSCKELVENHTNRYNILIDFFIKYNEQLPTYYFGTLNPSGYCGVVELFDYLVKKQLNLKDIYISSDKYLANSIIKCYLSELAAELNCF